MTNLDPRPVILAIGLFLATPLFAPAQGAKAPSSPLAAKPAWLQSVLDDTIQDSMRHFAESKLDAEDLAVTFLLWDESDGPLQKASHRGTVRIYPASVIKLFYLVAAHRWMEDGKLEDTPELRRAMSDMIVRSYNEATHYVIDLLTETTSGPELSPEAMTEWYHKRNAVNRYFALLGYQKVNANRKPWCEGPYGRETQSIRLHAPNHRNWLTTDETSRLMHEIATGRAVNASRSAEMRQLMKRDPIGDPAKRDQGNAYTGAALPKGARLWSKAGWTSQVRHDAAYVELEEGIRFVLVIFTERHAHEREIIPHLARGLIERLGEKRGLP